MFGCILAIAAAFFVGAGIGAFTHVWLAQREEELLRNQTKTNKIGT